MHYKVRNKVGLVIIQLVCSTSLVWAQDSYPESILREAYAQETQERLRLEELERRAVRDKADYERRVVEIEQAVLAKKLQTESYQLKAEELHTQLETMNTELFDAKSKNQNADIDIKVHEDHFQKVQSEFDAVNKEHSFAKQELERKESELSNLKAKLELSVAKYRVESEKMRQDISVMEAEIASADAKRADLETSEMQVRVEWLANRQEAQDKRDLKEKYIAQANDSKRKLELAKQELSKSQQELNKLAADVKKQSEMTRASVQKYEKEMLEIARKKAVAEADTMRVESEKEKLSKYVDNVKAARNSQSKNMEDTQSALIQSRLALESVKTDLTKIVAGDQKVEFESQKMESRIRGLASAAEASEILDGGRLFITNKTCPSYRRPASQSPEAYQIEAGKKLLGRESVGSWIKLTSEGKSIYIDKSCGQFEER